MILLLLFLLLLIQGFASNEIYISSNGSSEASCGSIHSLCLSLSDITQWENDTVVIIEGSIVLDRVIKIHSIHNLTFTSLSANSNEKEKAAIINCVCPSYNNCGLIIEDCQDVTFNELSVFGCSMKYEIQVLMGYYYRSGIIMNTTNSIALSNVSISNNIGTGLLLINAAGNITIEGSIFSNNSIPFALQHNSSNGRAVHGGTGLVILISACEIINNCSHVSASGNYTIRDTLFKNNTVNLTNTSSRYWFLSYGGGLGILLILNVQRNTFNVEGSTFISNAAYTGGGMVWHCAKFCNNNSMNLSRCSFSNNYVSANDSGGGAMSIGIESYSRNVSSSNNITVTEATFSSNTGYYAAGVLVYCNALDPDKSIKSYNYVTFIESNWENNSGTASPAVYVEPNIKSQYYSTFTTITTFKNCSFSNNTIQKYYDPAKAPSYTFKEDVGVFVIAKLTVYFKGNNTFYNNSGTALYLMSGSAFFERGAVTVFISNTGTTGGAIRLVGYSNIQYNNDTIFEFTNNSASFVGGAIYVSIGSTILLSSQSCFLQYRNDDETEHSYETNAHFTFIDNWSSTKIADSIFLNTIRPCQFACLTQSGSVPNPTELFQNQSCIGKFDIENNEIASGGSLFKINQSVNFSIVPGRTFSLPLTLFDDMGQNVTNKTIFQPSLSSGSNIKVSSGFEFVAANKIQFTGKPGETSNLTLKILGTDTGASIGIELASCPPGYIIDDDSSICVCSASQNNKSLTYRGLTAFLVMSYFQCSRISFILLNYGTPHGIGGNLYRPLVFWDGSLEYFSPHHLQYAIPAIISLIIFILPFPLILTFDGLLLKVESKLAIRFAFIRRLMPWTAIHYKVKPLLDSFQGPFKDQYRFFAGLYFFYRCIVLCLLVLASMALVVFLVIHAMAQPFQEKSHNVCALLGFTNMALINAFTMRIYYLVSNYGYTAETITLQWIQMGLIYAPLFAAVLKEVCFDLMIF
uniref:Right handed beta helix domain-containing protein n=1 Tax=Amphimedon queenslandica TaxID=400682 RepID=A0A1X7VCF0_AMPQE